MKIEFPKSQVFTSCNHRIGVEMQVSHVYFCIVYRIDGSESHNCTGAF